MKRMRERGLAAMIVLALAGGLAACGDDEDTGSSDEAAVEETASVEEVTLVADDISETEKTFELSATPSAETKSVTFDNQGDEVHAMVFAKINEGYTVDEAFELQGEKGSAEDIAQADAKPGESTTVDIKEPLDTGHYVMLCPIPNQEGEPHYKLGQLEEFDIE